MNRTTSRLALLFAARAAARRDLKVQKTRRQREFLKTPMDELEKRELLAYSIVGSGSIVSSLKSMTSGEQSVSPSASYVSDINPAETADGFGFASSTKPVDTTETSSGKSLTLDDLDPLARYAISASIGADQAAYSATANSNGYSFNHQYSVSMTTTGTTFQAGADSWQFMPKSYGYGSAQQPIASSTPTASKNRVTYDTAGIDTWFVNGPLGVQQGFTVENRPDSGNPLQPLVVTVGIGGSLSASVQADGDGLNLTRADGTQALTFGGLVAYDSTGRMLDAHLAVQQTGSAQELQFVVDDRDAVYPLTIDPYTQVAKLTASGGASNDRFGNSVSLSSDGSTALVGAYGVSSYTGAAYIYTKSGGSWATTSTYTAKLTASLAAAVLIDAGDAIADAGDTNRLFAFDEKLRGFQRSCREQACGGEK